MIFSEKLLQARNKKGVSQEAVAEAIGVSRQAIQKWESGASMPDISNLISLASYFNLSIDYLVTGKDTRSIEEVRVSSNAEPTFDKWNHYEAYYKNLGVEYLQSIDEGKDISAYKNLFDAVYAMPNTKEKDEMADTLYKLISKAPQVKDYPYVEPSDFDAIKELSDFSFGVKPVKKDEKLKEKIAGAWYGRICGCLLGKAVEGMRYDELSIFLKRTGNSPMHRYIVKSEAEKNGEGLEFPIKDRAYTDGIMDGMPVDDDTNYIIIAYLALLNHGRDFTSEDMANIWILTQGKNAYCTAERVAYRNFVNGYLPPESAVYKNPFREWIGAQIRGDYFGWVCPGDPESAANMAWRDARMSHIKNGIYGEMWVSAMLAAAATGLGIKDTINAGLAYIPKTSRLYEAIQKVIAEYDSGKSQKEFFDDFHKRWDDRNGHHWCHTISNAEIVTACLLYGGGDYGKSVCMAVEQGLDTDCNAATVGSVIGMIIGKSGIPSEWKDKIDGKLNTSIFGYQKVNVDDMVEKTLEMI